MRDRKQPVGIHRRTLLAMGAGSVLISVVPGVAYAEEADMQAAIAETFGARDIVDGPVTLKLPPISENGYSVPLSVSVDSPMTRDDYVKQIAIFSPRNPRPQIANFYLGPLSGKAEVRTRIRLSASQTLVAIAEMNDGKLVRGTAETVVTLAACVVL